MESLESLEAVVSIESMLKMISFGGAIGGFGNASADIVRHVAAIAARRTVLASAWREKDLSVVLFIIFFVLLTV